tara:strand:+ start:226 stop:807 length:582 start_codon:yes stop_codon:yes gene_type:complete
MKKTLMIFLLLGGMKVEYLYAVNESFAPEAGSPTKPEPDIIFDPETGLPITPSTKDHNQKYLKKSLSVGLFDDKAGLSLFGVSVSTNLGNKNEIFVSGGTTLILHSLSIGLIHYYRKSRFSVSSLFSIKHQIPNNEYMGQDPIQYLSSALTLEYHLFNNMNLKAGGAVVLDNAENEYEFWAYPFLNLTFQFLD